MKSERIKEIRISRGLTLVELAEKTGYTASYISKIERKLKTPSLEALKEIADCLNVPVTIFFVEEYDRYLISKENVNDDFNEYFQIKANGRRKINDAGKRCEIITPVTFNNINNPGLFGYCNYLPPKTLLSESLTTHPEEESMIVIQGKVKVNIKDEVILLEKGDSLYIHKNVPHTCYNPFDTESIIICYQLLREY